MIKVNAEFIEAHEEIYTPEYSVVGIYFGEGDPEQGGEHWNFTQSISDDEDEGVCVVKEVQQITFYGNIDSFILSRDHLTCIFSDSKVEQTGTKELVIYYQINDIKWIEISNAPKKIFINEHYFKIT